jgi:hypothetical protein
MVNRSKNIVNDNKLISLLDAAKLPWLPSRRRAKDKRGKPGDGRLNVCTLWRWITKGIIAGDGVLVRLRAIRVGGTACTSEAWLQEFFQTLTDRDPALAIDAEQSAPRTPGQVRRADERADKLLVADGI